MNTGAAEILAQARAMLTATGAPINTDNLNRAALAIARGETTLGEAGAAPASMQSRRGNARSAVSRALPLPPPETPSENPIEANIEAGMAAEQLRPMGMPGPDGDRVDVAPNEVDMNRRGNRVMASTEANERHRGTINGAQPIAEDDPTGGMFEGNQPRQATDVNDPTGAALTALALGLGGGPALVSRMLPQAATAAATRVGANTVRGDVASQTANLIRSDRNANFAAAQTGMVARARMAEIARQRRVMEAGPNRQGGGRRRALETAD